VTVFKATPVRSDSKVGAVTVGGVAGAVGVAGEDGVTAVVDVATFTAPTAHPPNTARLANPISATAITRDERVLMNDFIVFSVKNFRLEV
jgi:hypothetical protein